MTLQLKIDAYMAPIPGSNPSGENLRYTPVYDQIREAKRADDLLDKGEWLADLKSSDWRLVIKLCGEALMHETKDLQIAAWLTEALVHRQGFAGLAFGLRLLAGLVTDFWETLYPEIEEDDLGFRAGPITYLNEKLPAAVYQVPICDPEHTRGFAFFEWQEALSVGDEAGMDKEQKARRRQMIADGKVSPEDFQAAVKMSSIGFYHDLCRRIGDCLDLLGSLDEIVTSRFAADPPGLTRLAEALEACRHFAEKIYNEKKLSEVAADEVDDLGPNMENDMSDEFMEWDDADSLPADESLFSERNAISDITAAEHAIWKKVARKAGNGHLKGALDRLMAAAALAPSIRQKNRFLLLVAKLCLRAGRPDLAQPIVEKLYELIETLKLEMWEHPAWIADVIETLYRCLEQNSETQTERAITLFQKLCTLNITKAATYRIGDAN